MSEKVAIGQIEMRRILRQKCEQSGSQAAWARRAGFTPGYVSDVLAGRRDVSEQLANTLGFVRRVSFFPLRSSARKTCVADAAIAS